MRIALLAYKHFVDIVLQNSGRIIRCLGGHATQVKMSMKLNVANLKVRSIAIVAIACFGVLAHAETITVPTDVPTIQ